MVGEIIELLEEGKILRESFEGEGYCEEVFMSSVEDFASELKEKSHFLFSSTKKATENEERKYPQNQPPKPFKPNLAF